LDNRRRVEGMMLGCYKIRFLTSKVFLGFIDKRSHVRLVIFVRNFDWMTSNWRGVVGVKKAKMETKRKFHRKRDLTFVPQALGIWKMCRLAYGLSKLDYLGILRL
jgi:hypothetical protein